MSLQRGVNGSLHEWPEGIVLELRLWKGDLCALWELARRLAQLGPLKPVPLEDVPRASWTARPQQREL